MNTWQVAADGTTLEPATRPRPEPGPGELRVRVHAAGVTPTELLWYPTTHAKDGRTRTAAVPGHEFSGVVDAVGDGIEGGADGFAVGQTVFGMNDWFDAGATAEFCLTRPEWVAAKPAALTHVEAAAVPIGALTALQGLFDKAGLRPGERVLVHGGSGAVGTYAVRLAARHGAAVTTTASRRNAEFLRRLGAAGVIDYRDERFEDVAGGFDVVFDGVGGETLRRSWAVLRPGGRLVTIAADSEGTADDRTKAAFFIVEPRRDELDRVAGMLARRELEAFVDAVVPFGRANDAYAGRVEGRAGRGKVVVAVME